MAHVLKGYLYGLSTDREAEAVARACHAAARACRRRRASGPCRGARPSRRRTLARGRSAARGRHHREPRDALALQAGHQIDFFTGNSRMLRDRIARALAGLVGRHARLSRDARHAGLRPRGDGRLCAAPKPLGRSAVEIEPRDGWAQHAVAHVMEMQSRQRDGIAWMRANPDGWTERQLPRRSTIGGTWRCSTTISARSTRCWRCSTGRSTARARRWR